MHLIGALFLMLLGTGVRVVAYRGHRDGELPAGARGFHASWRPNREDNPFAFHFFLLLYVCGGFAPAVWGLQILPGMAPAMKRR